MTSTPEDILDERRYHCYANMRKTTNTDDIMWLMEYDTAEHEARYQAEHEPEDSAPVTSLRDLDEPTFTLRASDPVAPILVRLWGELTRLHDDNADQEDIDASLDKAAEMERWREVNL